MYLRVLGRKLHTILQTAAYNRKSVYEAPSPQPYINRSNRHLAAPPFHAGKNRAETDLHITLVIRKLHKIQIFCKHLFPKELQVGEKGLM